MRKGTQIAYIPRHACNDILHPDVEFGFVISQNRKLHCHFCRYWRRGSQGILRITANSGLTLDVLLVQHISVSQSVVDKCLKAIRLNKPL